MFACLSIRLRSAISVLLCVALIACAGLLPAAVATEAQMNATPVPIIMYHSVLRDQDRSGKYIITPQTVEADLAYLSDRGYTTMLVRELAEALITGKPLPEKPVIITLDDGYLNNLTYVLPILERYDMKAVISVVGQYSEKFSETPDSNPAYAHLTWEDIAALEESGRIEIANHSYNLHRQEPRHGTLRKKGESLESYRKMLLGDTKKNQLLLKENCGIVPSTYTYPFGQISPEAQPILQEMGFTALLTCYERVNYATGREILMDLGRFNRPAGVSTEKFMKKLGVSP